MSDVVRLTLVSHGMTDAMAAGRFPTDEPVNAIGRQTAELLGLRAESEPALADLDHGSWRGNVLGGVLPAELAIWLTDPAGAPHGGESVVAVMVRVRRWLDSLGARRGRIVAVTHPAVIRAAILIALDAPPKSFWRIDVSPASRTVMHLRGQAWTLRSTG